MCVCVCVCVCPKNSDEGENILNTLFSRDVGSAYLISYSTLSFMHHVRE